MTAACLSEKDAARCSCLAQTRHMKALLADISALKVLRSARVRGRRFQPVMLPCPDELVTGSRGLDRMGRSGLATAGEPAHLLVPRGTARSRPVKVVQHEWDFDPLAPGSAYLGRASSCLDVDRGVLSLGPGLCLLTLARRWPLSEVAQLANEFCGCYSLTPDGSRFVQTGPLATVKALCELAYEMDDRPGAGRLRAALALAGERAESPFEAQVRIWLCAPRSLGGFACRPPEYDAPIPLARGRGFGMESRTSRIDLFWRDAGIGVECDGSQHGDPKQRDKDSVRDIRLSNQGIREFRISTRAFHTFDAACELGRTVRKWTGLPALPEDAAQEEGRHRLWLALVQSQWDRKPLFSESSGT